jgi:hypothetical protein
MPIEFDLEMAELEVPEPFGESGFSAIRAAVLVWSKNSNDVAEAERITLRKAFWQQRATESGVHIVFRLSFISAFGLINRVLSGGIS